jgi:hypothetical protein
VQLRIGKGFLWRKFKVWPLGPQCRKKIQRSLTWAWLSTLPGGDLWGTDSATLTDHWVHSKQFAAKHKHWIFYAKLCCTWRGQTWLQTNSLVLSLSQDFVLLAHSLHWMSPSYACSHQLLWKLLCATYRTQGHHVRLIIELGHRGSCIQQEIHQIYQSGGFFSVNFAM